MVDCTYAHNEWMVLIRSATLDKRAKGVGVAKFGRLSSLYARDRPVQSLRPLVVMDERFSARELRVHQPGPLPIQ